MSKNYELLQQAEFGLGAAPGYAPAEKTGAADAVASAAPVGLTAVEPSVREETLKLVHRLFLAPDQVAPKAVLFASVDASLGASWLCAIAAKLLAESVSGSVCLVEGNFRSSSLPELVATEGGRGLVDSLREDAPVKSFARQIGRENLWFLPSGTSTPDSVTLLNSDRMRERIAEMRREFDFLLFNAPPLNTFADGTVLGRLVDGIVLILEESETRREAAVRTTENLRAMSIPVLGAVLNNRTFPIPTALYKRL